MADTQAQTGIVIPESNFGFTPAHAEPTPGEHQEFAQSLKDIVSEIEGEWVAGKAQAGDQEQPGEVPAETPVTQEAAPAEAEAPAEDPAIARGMERLVQREVALQAREAQLQVRETEAASLRQELATLKARMPAEDIQEKLFYSPSEAIKALGHDPRMVARLLIAEHMKADGQEVPPALQSFVERAGQLREQASQRAELSQLKAQLAERARIEQATSYFNGVAAGAREYVSNTVGVSKTLPTLAAIAKANPERAHREIMEEITTDARNRMSTDPNGEPMTYEMAAKKVEARLSDWKSLLVQTPTGTTQAPSGAANPKPPVTTKPPEKPLKPWETPANDIYKQGIAEAEREFYRAEQARLARR